MSLPANKCGKLEFEAFFKKPDSWGGDLGVCVFIYAKTFEEAIEKAHLWFLNCYANEVKKNPNGYELISISRTGCPHWPTCAERPWKTRHFDDINTISH